MTENKRDKIVSIKLTSSENIIAKFLDISEEMGVMLIECPLKIIQGIGNNGQDFIIMQKYDPASTDKPIGISSSHIISISDVSYRYKQEYITSLLRVKLNDIEATNENEVYDYLTTHMMKLCEDIGVEAKMSLMPVSLERMVKH